MRVPLITERRSSREKKRNERSLKTSSTRNSLRALKVLKTFQTLVCKKLAEGPSVTTTTCACDSSESVDDHRSQHSQLDSQQRQKEACVVHGDGARQKRVHKLKLLVSSSSFAELLKGFIPSTNRADVQQRGEPSKKIQRVIYLHHLPFRMP
jgi:hypothetical protein